MSWEPAERVQKNDKGEYRAFIGGGWVPVQKAQKNEAGLYRVQRFQRQEMEEPEFEKEAKVIAAGSTLGGTVAETAKGLARGASNVGLMASKGALGALFPVPLPDFEKGRLTSAGELMARGGEALAAPSRELVKASPVGPAEAVAGAVSEVGGEFLAPGIPRVIQGGANLVSKIPGVKPAAAAAHNFIDRLFPGGAERAVGRALLNLSGDKTTQVMRALADPAVIVPGSIPTAAETAAKAGSAEFSGAQRLAERRLPTAYTDIAAAQETARRGAIQAFGKTPEKLEGAITARAKQAKDLYEQASKQVLMVDDELTTLFGTDSMKKAMGRVQSIETEIGKARPSPQGTMSVGKLHYLKMAMDDFVKDPDKFGIAGLETAAYQGTRKALVDWISTRSPLYDKARQAFSEASKQINVMQVGQQLEKSLTGALPAERPGPFATAMREAPKTIEKATRSPRFTNLEQAVGKENTAAAEAVLADLSRSAQHEKLAQAGASRAKDIITTPGLPATGPLNQAYMIFKTVFNRFGQKLGESELQVLSEIMRTPKETLRVMNNAAAREALAQQMIKPPVPMTLPQRLRTGGIAAGAGELQESP